MIVQNEKKILLVVLDGLGGLPGTNGKTELETAQTPNLDNLAQKGILGLTEPVFFGITPGSGPAHLALFGYDPIKYKIGRGILEALGIGLKISDKDLCVRANFATINKSGVIIDRRAGRLPTEANEKLSSKIQKNIGKIDNVETIIRPGKEHRFVVLFRGQGLDQELTESDPQKEGKKPLPIKPIAPKAKKSARIINRFLLKATKLIKDEPKANYILLRGFAKKPDLEQFSKRYGLSPACVATYPMYKGIARLLGMEVLETSATWDDEIQTVKENRKNFDFFYLHFKEIDKMGEDGNFTGKVQLIEEFDKLLPKILELNFDVLCITSDHSTPAVLKSHSWHPNPFLLVSQYMRPDGIKEFSERACAKGSLSLFPQIAVMNLLLAHSLRLKKFGA